MVATDGHRLAVAETDHKFAGLSNEARTLVPKKAMTEIQRLAGEAGEDGADRIRARRQPSFLPGRRRACSSRASSPGNSPITRLCCRATTTITIVLERGEFNDAVRRVSQLADQRSHAREIFRQRPKAWSFPRRVPEYGDAKETIEKEYKGEAISIGFNGQYLLDFLAAAADGPISVELKDEQSAGQLRPLADEQYRYRYVIMPMRI